tara:strand:- start:1268 stop:1480 length:213 start_codon:yes stop_codon:yes gene_type:complete
MVKKPVKELKNIHFCIIMIKTLIGIAKESADLKRSSENSKKRSVLGMYVRHVIEFFSHLLRKNADTATKV